MLDQLLARLQKEKDLNSGVQPRTLLITESEFKELLQEVKDMMMMPDSVRRPAQPGMPEKGSKGERIGPVWFDHADWGTSLVESLIREGILKAVGEAMDRSILRGWDQGAPGGDHTVIEEWKWPKK